MDFQDVDFSVIKDEELRMHLLEKKGLVFRDIVWNELKARGCVNRLKDGIPGALDSLIQEHNRITYDWMLERPGRKAGARLNKEPIPYEPADQERIRALSEYFVCLANEQSDVRTFREQVLGESEVTTEGIRLYAQIHGVNEEQVRERYIESGKGIPYQRILTPEEAQAFLTSHATAILSLEQFREWKIPVIEHTATLGYSSAIYSESDFGKHDGHSVVLKVDPPGDTFVVRAPSSNVTIDGYRLVAGQQGPEYPYDHSYGGKNKRSARSNGEAISQDDDTQERVFAAMLSAGRQPAEDELSEKDRELLSAAKMNAEYRAAFVPNRRTEQLDFEKTLHYWASNDYAAEEKHVWPSSLLDNLRLISESLAKRFHWLAQDATMFVLTGEMPYIQALDLSTTTIGSGDFNDASINLNALPWVSLDTVKKVYRKEQQSLMFKCGKRAKDTLEVFRFVTREEGTTPSEEAWQHLFEKWRSKNPKSLFRSARDLKMYYNRAKNTLVYHDYAESRRLYDNMQQEPAKTRFERLTNNLDGFQEHVKQKNAAKVPKD